MSRVHVFMSASAQEENLGDLILRREMISWLRSTGQLLHVYVGAMPAKYVKALDLEDATVYRSSGSWGKALLRSSARREAALVFSPGQQGLMRRKLEFEHALVNVGFATAVRLGGGQVMKIGRSLEGSSRLMLGLERMLARLSNVYVSRDQVSADRIPARPAVMPDVAVGASHGEVHRGAQRTYFAMSWRHDREVDHGLVSAMITNAREASLVPIFVSQVWKDSPQHAALASEFGVDHLAWDDRDHVAQLARVEAIYAKTSVMVSNRLHAIIMAWNLGAVPFGYSGPGDSKIWNHLDELGMGDFVVRQGEWSSRWAAAIEDEKLSSDSQDAHHQACERVLGVRQEVVARIAAPA